MSSKAPVRTLPKLLLVSLLALFTFHGDISAQAPNIALQGSYANAVTDGVDVFSGKLEQILPLLSIKGRGEIGQGLYLPLRNTEWNVMLTGTSESSGKKYYYFKADQTNYVNNYARAGYSTLGKLEVETKFPRTAYMETPSVTEVRFTSNHGSIIHFRDVLTNGQPYEAYSRGCTVTTYHLNPEPACSRGRTFRSIDGSNATFVADADVYDKVYMDLLGGFSSVQLQQNVSGTLYLSDGSRLRFEGNYNNVTRITDRNGNLMKFDYVTEPGYTTGFLKKITDSLNREITITYGDNTQSSYFDEIVYKGFGGAERRIRINYTAIENVMAPGQSFGTGVFPGAHTRCWYLNGDGSCDPPWAGGEGWVPTSVVVPSSIVLPNGKEYQFYYNHYLEVARIKHPAGSYADYAYSGTIGAGADGFTEPLYMGPGGEIYRRVSSVKNFDETGQLVNEKTYSNIPQWIASSSTYIDNVTIDVKDGSGALQSRSKHYFYGSVNFQSMYTFLPASYGKEYKTEILDPISQGVLRKSETTWQQREPFQWCGGGIYVCYPVDTNFPNEAPAVDPRITEVKTTLETGEVTKKTFGYDQYNNVTDAAEYDYGSGTPGSLLRRTHTNYVTASNYTGAEVNLLRLPVQMSVYDVSDIERSRTTFEYDNYSSDSNHAPLTNRASISGFDAGFTTSYTTRGNPTASTRYLLTNGTVTDSITNYLQYDIAGNIVKAIDANGFEKTLDFTDHFGAPNGNVHSHSSPIELASVGQVSYAFASSATNSLGQTSYKKFDYYTALPVDAKDINGTISSAYSDNEPLDRLTKTIQAVNTSAQSQTTVSYDDAGRSVTTSSDLNTNADGALISKEFFDSFGRSIETRQYEGGSNYIVTKQQYDALGRVYRISNPYRPWQGESAIWTQSSFDALGRVLSVTTPDQAVAATSYNGSQVLVTDQLGKQRISKSNAIGQVNDVWEITAPDSATEAISFTGHAEVTAGYHTSYTYDVLENVTVVTQGTQPHRNFDYDSVKRLITAAQPESGTTGYQYDKVGNILVKTDARGVSTHFSYDAENRPIRRWYNSSSSLSATIHNTPALPSDIGVSNEVRFFYDSQVLPAGAPVYSRGASAGRLVAVTYGSNSSAGDYFGFNPVGELTLKIQQTGGINYQVQIGYNLGGAVTSQTYPSGHSVTYNYDQAGRLGDKDSQNLAFTGNLGDGVGRTYSAGIVYSPFGGMTKEQFGTGTPIYNKRFYNARGQLAEIRESTSYTGPGDSTWNRGAIINFYSACWGACGGGNSSSAMTDNNGSLKLQQVYIPLNDQLENAPSTMWTQNYDYDSLNRLQRVHEDTGNTSLDWQQEYVYDRFGNRRIHQSNTWGAGINKKEFTVNNANNRLGVPQGQSGAMTYDNSGNLTTDTYSGAGVQRKYDGENRMTSETQSNNYLAGSYTYDANGKRIRRTANGQETWQVYGIGGELLAEYPANGSAANPQKEYGYRNGELLIVTGTSALSAPAPTALAAAPSSVGTSITLSWSGASGAASYRVERKHAGAGYVLAGTSPSTGFMDTGVTAGIAYLYKVCAADGAGNCTSGFSNVVLGTAFGFTDPTIVSTTEDPTGVTATPIRAVHINQLRSAVNAVRSLAGLPNASWTNTTITAGVSVVSADDVRDLRTNLHEALNALGIQTSDYEDQTLAGAPNGTAIKKVHITQLRQRATSGTGGPGGNGASQFAIQWLVTDQLGTPRMIFDHTGSLATTKRHDYLPFGEESFADQGKRTPALGYAADAVRQKFTQYERDIETTLDYAQARYHGNTQGRFTSPDPFSGSMSIVDPQSMNRYSYVQNNPLNFTDPSGLSIIEHGFQFAFWGTLAEALPGFGTNAGSYIALYEQQYETAMYKTLSDAAARESSNAQGLGGADGADGGGFNPFYSYDVWGLWDFDDNGFLTWWLTGNKYQLPGESVDQVTVGPRATADPDAGFSAEVKMRIDPCVSSPYLNLSGGGGLYVVGGSVSLLFSNRGVYLQLGGGTMFQTKMGKAPPISKFSKLGLSYSMRASRSGITDGRGVIDDFGLYARNYDTNGNLTSQELGPVGLPQFSRQSTYTFRLYNPNRCR